MIVLGIDPGGATTAFVLVETANQRPVTHLLVNRKDHDGEDGYLAACARHLVRFLTIDTPPLDLVALEGLVHPTPHLGIANVAGLIDTATVRGHLLAYLRAYPIPVEHVRPGGHGSAPAAAYPPELIGPREGPKLTGRLRHARSAFDVALTGARLRRHPALPR